MSSRTRPPWLKKLKRIIGRRLRSGSLTPEAASLLCDEVLPSIQRLSPPPAVSAAVDVWRADRRPSWELEQFIGKCYRSGTSAPRTHSIYSMNCFLKRGPAPLIALTQLLTVAWPEHGPSGRQEGGYRCCYLHHPHQLLLPSGLLEPWLRCIGPNH